AILLVLACTGVMDAKTRRLTILGDQTIVADFEGRMPKPVETNDVSIDVAGLVIEETQLKYTFGLDSYDSLTRVLVEDVSGTSAVVLIDDSAPKQEWTRWKGFSAPLPLSSEGVPWIWEKGDTTKVFRFTMWS